MFEIALESFISSFEGESTNKDFAFSPMEELRARRIGKGRGEEMVEILKTLQGVSGQDTSLTSRNARCKTLLYSRTPHEAHKGQYEAGIGSDGSSEHPQKYRYDCAEK